MAESQSFWAHLRRYHAAIEQLFARIVGGSNGSAMEKAASSTAEVLQRSMPVFHLRIC